MVACGGGGGGGAAPASKALTKAYLFCAMSSNSRVVGIESSMVVPNGVDVPHDSIASTATVYNLNATSAVVSSLFMTGGTVTGSFDTSNRSMKYSMVLTPPVMSNISSSTKSKGKEFASLSFPFIATGTAPTALFPDSDSKPTIYKERNNNRDYLNGCTINYVTTYQ